MANIFSRFGQPETVQQVRLARRNNSAPMLGIVLVFSLVGWLIIQRGHADPVTPTSAAPASSATSQSTVTAPQPTNLEAFPGGNSIALVWDMPTAPLKAVEVYRDNQMIATVTPKTSAVNNEALGRQYIDQAVTPASTYRYQLKGVGADNTVSDLTAAVSVTEPQRTVLVPTVIINSSQAPDLASYLTTTVQPLIETWYPKVADTLAYPTYSPPATVTVMMDTATPKEADRAACYVTFLTSVIHCDPAWLRQAIAAHSPDIAAVFTHELTHVVQVNYPADPTGWATEGMADWSSDFYARQIVDLYRPKPDDKLGSYQPGAFLIEYIRRTYDANFPRNLNLALHTGTYSAKLIANVSGGKTVDQVWQEIKAAYNTATATITGIGGKCLSAQGSIARDGTYSELSTCAAQPGQQWVLTYQDAAKKAPTSDGTFEISAPQLADGSYCLDSTAGNVTDPVALLWGCDELDTQLWRHGPDNSLVNVQSGKCLATATGTAQENSYLVTTSCDGSSSQQWQTPQ